MKKNLDWEEPLKPVPDTNLMDRIRNQYPSMSKGQKLIAKFMLESYDKAAFMTAGALGRQVGVSESTVVRFACALGYEGYPKLQRNLQEIIKNKLTTVQRLGRHGRNENRRYCLENGHSKPQGNARRAGHKSGTAHS